MAFPDPYQSQLSDIQRRQQMAQMLMGRGMNPQGYQTGFSSAANIIAAMLGANQAQGLQQEEYSLAQQRQQDQQKELAAALGAYRGDKPYQMSEQELFPGEQPIQGLSTMGQGQNRDALIQALAGSSNPQLQQAAIGQMLAAPVKAPYQTVKPGESIVDPTTGKVVYGGGQASSPMFEGTGMDAQSYNMLIQYNQKKQQGMPTTPQEDMAYNLVYQRAAKPSIVTLPDGRAIEVPGIDVSGFAVPAGAVQRPASQAPVQGVASGREVGKRQFPQGQSTAAGYANRMTQAENILGQVQGAGYDPTSIVDIYGGSVPVAGQFIRSPEGKLYRQAQEDWVRAKLRKESGAVIGADEMRDEITTYFPQPGDTPEVIAQKTRARQLATQNLVQESQGAFEEMFGGQQAQQPAGSPVAGTVENGYRFKGGNPADPNNWEKM